MTTTEKIRAAIDARFKEARVENTRFYYDVLDIIDKYAEQEPKTWQFAEWVAREIFDDMWEYNKDAFAEIACRKLAKLGIVKESGDVWELVEQQESEDKE